MNFVTSVVTSALSVGPATSACALLRDRAEIGPGRFPQSEAIPDTAAATGKAISARIGHRGAVSPVWMRMEIIRDEFSNASGFTRNWAKIAHPAATTASKTGTPG